MGVFDVELMYGADTIEVGEFTYDHTVLQVKQYYYDNVNNSQPVDKLKFTYLGRVMSNDKKLGYYNDDVEFSMIIVLTYQTRGGSYNIMDSLYNSECKIIRGKQFTFGQELPVWDKMLEHPKYLQAKIIELYDTGFKIRWINFPQPKYDTTIFAKDFENYLEDFRNDGDSKMDDIKEDNNDSNANDVNQNISNNTNVNKKAHTGIDVRKIRNVPFKAGEEVRFLRPGTMRSSWESGVITGFMNNNCGLIVTYTSKWTKNEVYTINKRDFDSKIKWKKEWKLIRNVPFKICEILSVYDDDFKKFCKGKVVKFAKDKSGKEGLIIRWVGHESYPTTTIWEDTFDFYVEIIRNKGNNNTQTNIPTDVISKQPIGLRNFGNTCYFNSALQCLMSIKALNEYIINLNNYPNNGIISSLKRLYKGGNTIKSIINECAKVDENLRKNVQYDSVLAMNVMLELIDKESMNNNYVKISKVKHVEVTSEHSAKDALNIGNKLYDELTPQSKIRDLVYGIQLLMYTCLKCNSKSKVYKPFGYIALPLKSAKISINVYPIKPGMNKQNKILKCDEAILMQIRLKYKIKVFKDRALNEILSKNNIINDNNAFDISIFTLNTSNKINKWITYYNDNDYCESFNNENYVFAQINAKNDDSFNVKCFDILYDKNNINDVEISVLKIEKDKNSIKGKKLYDHFGQKNCQDKLYIFHNNKFVRNESTVKVTNKSVLIFIWSNNINASVHDVSLENIVGSDNLKDIQDAKREVSKLIKTCQTSKFPIIRNNIPIENLTSEYQEMDKILQVYKLRDDILKLCGKNAKIKLIASKANTVEECLKILEEITPDNGIRCEGCNNKKSLTMNKQMCVLKTPKVLLLEIDREVQDDPNQFNQYSGYDAWGGYRKTFNDVNIKYPIDGLQFKDSIYNLYAISVHSGYSTNGGHYVSYVRREVNGKTLWYNCNDISISKMGEGTYNSKMRLQSNSAKLLVYIKVH